MPVPELEAIAKVRDFLETGGDVLLYIGFTTLAMWTLILERYWYFQRVHPKLAKQVEETWKARQDRSSWNAHQIRRLLISEVQTKLDQGLIMIKTLVALCPLLGLLGTVTGMIEVFDVMAVSGSGNARAMASGVQKATIPTMAGMVAALSGLMLSIQIERFVGTEGERVADQLTIHHE
jgi:biopolymer transport protein ExbB